MKLTAIAKFLFSASVASNALAFAPNHISTCRSAFPNVKIGSCLSTSQQKNSGRPHIGERSPPSSHLPAQQTETTEDGFLSNLTINPVYSSLYILFVSVATYASINETSGASKAIIEMFMADPLHPGMGSALFETVWNAIGLIGLPLACLIMPGAKGQKFNPSPFLFASAFAGYGSMGIFMSTRKPVVSVKEEDLGWFTKNVLENKIFNWALFAVLANAYVITGAGEQLLTNAGGTFVEFKNMVGGSALGSATTVDFSILCLTGASLVPEDLRRRGFDDDQKAYAIAASTLILPAAGLALYAALRPSLVFGDEK
mmetsp:Transcript_27433/g.40517  ORF Transcript_27433/g.40517 Transcript_27433/m.40517 type:complete len:314 (-) Transcript_27433:47-988(-)